MNLTIKALTPDLIDDYFDFFDNRAFSDGSPNYPCYCNAFNMSSEQIKTELFEKGKAYGGVDGKGRFENQLKRWLRVVRFEVILLMMESCP